MKRFTIINILLALVMININGCSGTKNTVPSNVNIKKNQLIYINDTMEIWANDGEGNHHNYTPQDSAEYKVVTNHIGSNLNSVFLGYCNLHRYSAIGMSNCVYAITGAAPINPDILKLFQLVRKLLVL